MLISVAAWSLVKTGGILSCESIPASGAALRANTRSRSKSAELCVSGQREERIDGGDCRRLRRLWTSLAQTVHRIRPPAVVLLLLAAQCVRFGRSRLKRGEVIAPIRARCRANLAICGTLVNHTDGLKIWHYTGNLQCARFAGFFGPRAATLASQRLGAGHAGSCTKVARDIATAIARLAFIGLGARIGHAFAPLFCTYKGAACPSEKRRCWRRRVHAAQPHPTNLQNFFLVLVQRTSKLNNQAAF
jgi:hypothetical protein